jgi:two-component system cell cycle response regulator
MLTLSPTTLKGWKILVVDDEIDSLDVAAMLFGYYGAEVMQATTGKAGLQLAREHTPMFILSDLSMPNMSGWDLITALKTNPATASIPVIALTAHAMPGDRDNAMSSGFHNYITKPLNPETFVKDTLTMLQDIPTIAAALNNPSES